LPNLTVNLSLEPHHNDHNINIDGFQPVLQFGRNINVYGWWREKRFILLMDFCVHLEQENRKKNVLTIEKYVKKTRKTRKTNYKTLKMHFENTY